MAERRTSAATTEASSTIQALKSDSEALMSSHEYADLNSPELRSVHALYRLNCIEELKSDSEALMSSHKYADLRRKQLNDITNGFVTVGIYVWNSEALMPRLRVCRPVRIVRRAQFSRMAASAPTSHQDARAI